MIELLEHRNWDIAREIHAVLERSYREEAGLLDISDFPPLRRTVSLVRAAAGNFVGYRINADLAGVVEYRPEQRFRFVLGRPESEVFSG